MKNFQIILIAVFIVAAVLGLLVFSGAIPLGGGDENQGQGTVVVWGTFRAGAINPLLEDLNTANQTFLITYVEKNADTFDQELLEALATGTGPDMFFMPGDLAFHYRNKILAIPYSTYSVSSFKKTFAGAGEVFMNSNGIMAFPMTIDPLVMYYNRSMLDTSGITNPPANWTQFIEMVPTLTKKDDTNRITRSAVALGHFSNVSHAKDILSMLFMQSGSQVVAEREGRFVSDLISSTKRLDPAIEFYTDFADPLKTTYSWNKSFPLSRDYFSTNNLAFYFGHASELSALVNRNPNQNFLAAEVPQIENSNFKVTSANVTGLAISVASKNVNTAFIAANMMSSGEFALKLAANLGVAPARRDLLAVKTTDAFNPVFYRAALYSRSWLDPSPEDTVSIFRNMIENVLSNTLTPDQAISDASSKMSLLLNK